MVAPFQLRIFARVDDASDIVYGVVLLDSFESRSKQIAPGYELWKRSGRVVRSALFAHWTNQTATILELDPKVDRADALRQEGWVMSTAPLRELISEWPAASYSTGLAMVGEAWIATPATLSRTRILLKASCLHDPGLVRRAWALPHGQDALFAVNPMSSGNSCDISFGIVGAQYPSWRSALERALRAESIDVQDVDGHVQRLIYQGRIRGDDSTTLHGPE